MPEKMSNDKQFEKDPLLILMEKAILPNLV